MAAVVPYPPTVPHETGMLDVGDGNLVYWETCGNPDGKPVLLVHGGPGSGYPPGGGRTFDPQRYRIVIFDQRGSGRSLPHASDPATSLEANTTWHLVADMELIREHLGIERWMLQGGSWGSTLTLAYAQTHPERVSEILLVAVTTSSRRELDWLYRGVARFFPEEWDRFRAGAGVGEHRPATERQDLVATYARLVNDPDIEVRTAAVDAWCRWEDTVLSLEPRPKSNPFGDRPSDARVALVRICSHFFANAAWLDEGVLIREAHRLAGIPGVLVHGRLDFSCPAETAYDLARAWPGSELFITDDGGHTGSTQIGRRLLEAADRFART
ncbi:prolyl aminopeptidase [Williamsia sp.]|uniref:prolyl aminopeptidase n=1 Tax=Williamsia sp. TaxID=1872085 RepID=UPI001A330036|nr:prolyl aminopeptidase [Williamsia sp.]MBJ7288310.1 prolyl aminopeptidase [Williamsia sp.]